MKKHLTFALAASLAAGGVGVTSAQARDYISIVGSSTVYPFATTVAEQFGKSTRFKTPKIESTGSGGGFKLFCTGVGTEHPDVTNSSRRIKKSEYDTCQENGVKDIVEIKIGYDGIVLANSKKAPRMSITRQELFLALAKNVPDPKAEGKTVPNPFKTWKDINPGLPDNKIEVMGPPPTSGTRDAFVELVMEEGCGEYPWIKELSKSDNNRFKQICHTVREDGAYIEAGENDNLIVQKIDANPRAFGIFGFSFLDQNNDMIQGAMVEGKEPVFENIAAGEYPVSRPLYFYVKKGHVGTVPGIEEFLAEFTSDKAWGEEGYLADKGLIPMPADERMKFGEDAKNLNALFLQ
ncbi:MAG: PstS family phosphate ABC transporter substrate-binding protein [Desulfobulbaceae bacterium]|nr:PstS family phosphate ABC transporter substrate-binding protein [Desulfobulbaceae bacterium]